MLKPSRNILRKEIKKDPLLDTFEKIEAGIENNRKNLIKILVISASVIIGGLVFLNNQRKNELESNSAFGLAMVAYSNSDYDNAKFQFESIQSNYEGTKSGILANYYLGKIAYYKDDYVLAELLLNDFIDKTKDITLVSGAIKQLFDISFQNAEYLKSSSQKIH